MTPELRQAIQLLQFTSQELNEYIKQEIEKNPLLELASNDMEHESIEVYDVQREEFDWKEFLENYDDISYRSEFYREDKEYNYENVVKQSSSLKEHLLFQLNVANLDNVDSKHRESHNRKH